MPDRITGIRNAALDRIVGLIALHGCVPPRFCECAVRRVAPRVMM